MVRKSQMKHPPLYQNPIAQFGALFLMALLGIAVLALSDAMAEIHTLTGYEAMAEKAAADEMGGHAAATADYLTDCDLLLSDASTAVCAVRVYDGLVGDAGDWRAFRATYQFKCSVGGCVKHASTLYLLD
jgi:hypothetical protein